MAVLSLLVATWQGLYLLVGPPALASPLSTFRAVANGFAAGWLGSSLLTTLAGTLVAFLIAETLGVFLALGLSRNRFWGDVFDGPIVWLYSIPKVVLYPIVVLLLGIGARSNIGFGVLQSVFPPLILLYATLKGIPATYEKTAQLYRMRQARFFFRIVLPYAAPALATGARYCFCLAYIGIVVAQMFAAEDGLGFELMKAISLSQASRMCAVTLVIIVVALAINGVLVAVERRVELRARA